MTSRERDWAPSQGRCSTSCASCRPPPNMAAPTPMCCAMLKMYVFHCIFLSRWFPPWVCATKFSAGSLLGGAVGSCQVCSSRSKTRRFERGSFSESPAGSRSNPIRSKRRVLAPAFINSTPHARLDDDGVDGMLRSDIVISSS